jgi:amino acid permease
MFGLALVAAGTLFMAWRYSSLNWLLLHLGIDACLAWYMAMLAQIRSRQAQKVANRYFSDSPREWEESPVKVVSQH